MRKTFLLLTFLLTSLAAHASGPPSVNPLLPAPNAPLSNLPVQQNFQHVYNDEVSIYGILNGLGTLSTQNAPLTVPNGGTGLTSVGPNGTCLTSNGSSLSYQSCSGGSGGSGITSQQIVSSGSTATAVCGEFVGFNSASGVAKTLTIPASTGSLCIIVTSDMFGDGFTNPITPVPVSGSIFGSPTCYTSHCSVTLLDTSSGWVPL